jgi:hypothetical protein
MHLTRAASATPLATQAPAPNELLFEKYLPRVEQRDQLPHTWKHHRVQPHGKDKSPSITAMKRNPTTREVGRGLDLDDQDQFTRDANNKQMIPTSIESVDHIFVCILFINKL